ncbi:MAG: nucleotidyltransferase family protein [Burkholderiales bacterium]|nr:nucleotidyltransferase family protein [Burkholderiales bacterium]
MILAAGRGERMRPLSDATPKPLLRVGGKPLIVWQIESLARAGFRTLVINAAHLAAQLTGALGDGGALGVSIRWSTEAEPLEVAGGIATAIPLLPEGPVVVVAGDVWTRFDYATLRSRADTMALDGATPRVHLVMVPNPSFHPQGDFALEGSRIHWDGPGKLTYGSIGVFDTTLFRELPRGTKLKLLPLLHDWIARGLVSGERYDGPWANVGTPAELAALDRQLSS